MVNGPGSISVDQSVWERLKNIPSQLAGWFYGKFVTVSTKIKHVFSSDDSVLSAGQPVSTTIGERTVSTTSNTHTQETPSLVTSSASYVITPSVGDASHAEASNHLTLELAAVNESQPKLTKGCLLDIYKDYFQDVGNDIQRLISTLAKEMVSISNANRARMVSICHLNRMSGFDDARFLQFADELKVKESVIKDQHELLSSEKIELLTRLNATKIAADRNILKLIRFNQSRLKVLAPEYKKIVARICASCQPNSAEPASKDDVVVLKKMVDQLDQIVSEFENGQVRDQIAQNAWMELQLSGVRKKLQDLTQLVALQG